MNYIICFCADGVLRAKYSDSTPMLPMQFIQKNSEYAENDLRYWVENWDNIVLFEEGLTISSFLFCLEPWVNFWSDLTRINIKEYLKEVRKPAIVKDNDQSWISLAYYTEYNLFSSYEEDENDDQLFEEDMNAWFDAPRLTSLSSKWDISSGYSVSHYQLGKDQNVAMEHTSFNEIANVKLILVEDHKVMFHDLGIRQYFGDKDDQLFQQDAFGINTLNHHVPLKFLVGRKYHTMREVVEGFFNWMYKDPVTRDKLAEDLTEVANYALEEIIADNSIEVENNNVVSLFKENHVNNNITTLVPNATVINMIDHKKETKENQLTGAIREDNENMSEEDIFWNTMLNRAKTTTNTVLKIGLFKEGLPPENRMYDEIIDPNDEKANPQDTPFKQL